MGVQVTFEMFGEKQFEREILRVGERADDARPLFMKLADDWVRWNDIQFNSEGARASGGWEPIKPATLIAKLRKGLDPRILHATGALRDALTDKGNIDITDSWMHLKIPDEVEEYGRYHQAGTSNMPRRRPLEFTEADRRVMTRRIQAWLINGELW